LIVRIGSLTRAVLALVALALGASGCAYIDAKQREAIFRVVKADRPGFDALAPGIEEVWIAVGKGGDRIHGWWWPADPANAPDAPTMLYLHGTRWNLTGNAWRIARLQRMGFNVLAIDYRGFGRSSGELPSEQYTYEDALAAWDYVRAREPDPAKRYVYGHSLGGAVGIELATRVDDIAGLIVESTFTSIRDMGDTTWLRYLPFGVLLTQRFDSAAKIARVKTPLLFVHGKSDRYVPYEMTERLYAAATAPKRLLLIENGNHSNASGMAIDDLARSVRELRALAAAAAPAPTRAGRAL
jgi:uncharacterized protein